MAAATQYSTGYDDGADLPPFMMQSKEEPALFNFRQILGALWRRKFLILIIMLLIVGAAYWWVKHQTELYVATGEVEIGIRENTVYRGPDVVAGQRPDFYFNETEAKKIKGSEISGLVAEKLGLYEDSSRLFTGENRNGGMFNSAKAAVKSVLPDPVIGMIQGVLDVFSGDSGVEALPENDEANVPPELAEKLHRQNVEKALKSNLIVDPSERARTIEVGYRSHDPELARDIANAYAEAYVESTRIIKQDANTQALVLLESEVDRAEQIYQQSEQELEQFRRDQGVVDYKNQTTLLSEQLAELNRQLVEANQDLATSNARFSQVQRLLASEERSIDTVAAVLDSPLIVRLREQESEVVRQIAELRTQLRERHPRLLLKKAELGDLRKNIAGEIDKIAIRLGNEQELARVRVDNLAAEVNTMKSELSLQTDAEVTMQAMITKRDNDKKNWEAVLQRKNEVALREREPQRADARVITIATTPRFPTYPRTSLMMAVALLGSALLGIVVVFAIEYMDAGFRSLEQLQQMAYVPALGLVPRLSMVNRGTKPEDFVLENPGSHYAESIRSIRTSLLLSNVDDRPRSVMFTSSIPAEGKTATTVSVARAAAKAGQRTIILDCDLRKPSVDDSLGVPNNQGLVEVLSGQASLDDVIEIDMKSTLHYITAGGQAPNPPDLLGSQAMSSLMDTLTRRYDLVVLDTPPVLPVSDALVMLRLVDKAIYLVRWGVTRREAVLAGIRQVIEANGDLAGVVMTRVDVKKHQKYSYSDSYYYYRGYGAYHGR